MEGQILGNRYELIEKIGGGGMALVYKAKCNLLNRFVAVKVLRTEFTNDEEFVKRFRIEAQSAASLSHPNIVSIYDVGKEENAHYIVMEYIDGVTLKEYIKNNTRLEWKEAVNIAVQICSAIEHAHRKRIVHRDIKPHNILMTKEGIAKVTDFGIARAVSSSTITMVGSTIGSVHYFSPEQARGGFTDEKSDLYSIGIALYEMVTGRVPFDGDTPVAVALKHLQVEAEQPLSINKDLPKGINDIIMKAIEKDQSKRYQSASEMLEDLNKVLKDPFGDFVNCQDTDSCPTRRIQIIKETKSDEKGNDVELSKGKIENEEVKKDRRTWILAIATSVLIMVTFLVITVFVIVPSIVDNKKDKEITLENYIGKDFKEVQEELERLGVTVDPKWVNDDSKPANEIIDQDPKANEKIVPDQYNPVTLTISKGQKLVKIPRLKNTEYRDAQTELSDKELIPSREDEFSEDVVRGYVIRTEPDMDEEVPPGTTVKVFISKGPEVKETTVPDLTNKSRADAERLLADANLKLGKVSPEDGINYVDKVILQVPAPNARVKEGTAVNITFEAVTNDSGNGDTGNNGENKNPESKTVQNIKVDLEHPEQYGDTIKVLIEVTPSDTNKSDILMNAEKNKTDFPITLPPVTVPKNGKTFVKVYLNDALKNEIVAE